MSHQVAIIGAGIAGLSAARKLSECGVPAIIFERASRPGGRLSTQKQHDRQFDHGAQYLTPHSRRSAVLFSQWRKAGWIEPWSVVALELPERKKIDTRSWHVAVPAQNSLARHLAAGLDCRYKTTIQKIEQDGDQRFLRSEKGERLGPFEIVLCAAAAEQTLELLLEPFPEMASLAKQVESRPCLATMVTFEEEVMVDFEAAFVNDRTLAWVCRDATKPDRPQNECWVLHATAEWSREQLNLPPEEVASRMLSSFARLCPVELPPVSYCRSHRWRFALPITPLELPFCYDDQLRIGVAGDWCSVANVDGAYWSGFDLAAAVVKSLRNQDAGNT